MAIKRGVSFYSYQQEQFFGRMDYHDMAKEMHDNLKCDGVEIISEATVPGYPFPSKEFLADWANTMARYDLKPVALDGFLDPLRFRDHVMNHREAAELLKLELKLAHDMGFTHVRAMTGLPADVAERALDTAEKLNVAIAWEIHLPIPIKPNPAIKGLFCESPGTAVQDTVDFIKKTGTTKVGFIPDMGIFNKAPYIDGIERTLRHMEDKGLAEDIRALWKEVPLSELGTEIDKRYPGKLTQAEAGAFHWKKCADPEDLVEILPYVFSFHGKCHDMVEIPGKPGQYEEPAEDFEKVIQVLKDHNWDGYICTEFEGQRAWQDMGRENLVDEVEQVRRNHEMMRRLIGE
ncbi:sugar phosphate isomerase/epimerase family protein [Murimonas intestini]|uniref:Sugar phosphate isomerase/epimerase n=1 Tax=Murimonas intestini TaxID=1337051 RepID=A0AB73T0N4_9FIRM|nr:hypothetical protein [Murimonas intestini]MCR1840123.1 hypothetical protein [Murimonas intestini]MCR1867575.1 hypothetical protein [Murimonas intestini]MCR1885010.1 hypothetical protein [Murimonas intestini]